MKSRLGRLETQFLAYAQMRRMRTVRFGDLSQSVLRLTPTQERKLLSRLARARVIARVRRGLYLVPPRLPLGGVWTPDETLAINTLIADRQGRYQISGPNAFNLYGYNNQVPNRVCAYNNRISGSRTVGAVHLTLIKIADKRLGGIVKRKGADGEAAVYASRARTLLDAVYDWSRFGTLPRAYDWIAADLRAGRIRAADLVKVTARYGDFNTIRRIGLLLERAGVKAPLLRTLEKRLPPITAAIPWNPSASRRGPINRRWGIIDNLDQRNA